MSIFRRFARVATALFAAATFATASQAGPVTTQMGLLIDESGSIGSATFNLMKSGFAAAILNIPTDGSVELTVYKFSNGATAVISPTIVTAANIATLSATVGGMGYSGGGTATDTGINAIAAAMLGSSNYSTGIASIINITTDGVPNSQSAAIAAAVSAETRGIDALTAEFVNASASGADFLRDLVFSPLLGPCNNCGTLLAANTTNIPNPMTSNPWIVPVTNTAAFGDVIDAKIQAVVNPVPEPATLLLVGIALAGLGAVRRRPL